MNKRKNLAIFSFIQTDSTFQRHRPFLKPVFGLQLF